MALRLGWRPPARQAGRWVARSITILMIGSGKFSAMGPVASVLACIGTERWLPGDEPDGEWPGGPGGCDLHDPSRRPLHSMLNDMGI